MPLRAWGWAGLGLAVLSVVLPTLRVPLAALGVLGGVIGWEWNGSLRRAGTPQTLIALLLGGTILLSGLVPRTEQLDPDDPSAEETSAPDFEGVGGSNVADEVPVLLNMAEMQREMAAMYPAELREAGVAGRTVLQLTVREDGTVDPSSIRIASNTHGGFGRPSRQVAEHLRFRPARMGGRNIAAAVFVTIKWRPERS